MLPNLGAGIKNYKPWLLAGKCREVDILCTFVMLGSYFPSLILPRVSLFMTQSTVEKYQRFADFYPYYLSEHQNVTCRRLHFIGTSLIVMLFIAVLVSQQYLWLWATPLLGYGFAWVGHFFYEHNRPATFRYPFYSLMADWVMFKDILIGRIKF